MQEFFDEVAPAPQIVVTYPFGMKDLQFLVAHSSLVVRDQ
jgi:hypothetical protein